MLHFAVFIYSLCPHTVGFLELYQAAWMVNKLSVQSEVPWQVHTQRLKEEYIYIFFFAFFSSSSTNKFRCLCCRTDSSHFRVFRRDAVKTVPPHDHPANATDACHGIQADSDSVMSSETITWWSINQAIKVHTMPITLFNKHTSCTHCSADGRPTEKSRGQLIRSPVFETLWIQCAFRKIILNCVCYF
jgi:hypothetical protein